MKRNDSRNKNVPGVDAEDSIGKATEDFGGYSVEDGPQVYGRTHPLGYEHNYDESGADPSPIRQRAQLNILESATPIHVS